MSLSSSSLARSRLLCLLHLLLFLVAVFGDDLPAQVDKHFVDVCAASGAGLVVRNASPFLRQLKGPCSRYIAVVFEIGFVANQNHGDVVVFFDAANLLAELLEFVQRGHACYGEDEQETLARFHVQFSHGGKLLGSSCVENLEYHVSTLFGPC